jgi:hypothetical protein
LAAAHVEAVVGAQPLLAAGGSPRTPRRKAPSARPSSERAPWPVTVPERHLPGCPGAGVTTMAPEADVLDPPGRRAEQERLAGPALVTISSSSSPTGAVGQEDAEEATVGDGAAARDREAPRRPGPAAPTDPVPHDLAAQLAELLAGVPAGQQVEHVDQQVRSGRRSWRTGARQRRQVVDRGRRDRRWPRSVGPGRPAGCAGSGWTR